MSLSNNDSESRNVQGPDRRALVFSLFAGAFAWTVHLILAATIAEWGFTAGLGDRLLWGVNAIAWSVIALTVCAVTTTAIATMSAFHLSRSYRGEGRGSAVDTMDLRDDSDLFLAQVSLWGNFLFLCTILAQSVPILFYLGG